MQIVYPIDKKYGEYVAMMKNQVLCSIRNQVEFSLLIQTYATEDALERGKDTFGPNVFDIPMPTFSDLYGSHSLYYYYFFFCATKGV